MIFYGFSSLGSLFEPCRSSIVVISEITYFRLRFPRGSSFPVVLVFLYFLTFFDPQSTKKRPNSHFGLFFSSLRSATFIFPTFDLVLESFWIPLASLWAPKIHFLASWELLVPTQRATRADPEPHWSPKRPPWVVIWSPRRSFWSNSEFPEVDF